MKERKDKRRKREVSFFSPRLKKINDFPRLSLSQLSLSKGIDCLFLSHQS